MWVTFNGEIYDFSRGRMVRREPAAGVGERLPDQVTPLSGYFNTAFVQELLEKHARAVDHGWRLWSLLFLTEWPDQRPAPARTGGPYSQPIFISE